MIRNKKNVYIRLNENGKAVTCTNVEKGLFEYQKAKNILNSLPKTLQRLKFDVVPISDMICQGKEVSVQPNPQNIIESFDYEIPDDVKRWVQKFGVCDEVIKEAKIRKNDLLSKLCNLDRELSNILHSIELQKAKNACEGYLEYKKIKKLLEKRRVVKDELTIIKAILHMDFRNFDGENISKAVSGLARRKFTIRFVEEDENGDL